MENAFPSKLRDATSQPLAEARLASLQEAFLMCGKTQEARDCDWDSSTHAALAELLVFAWAESTRARNKTEKEAAATFSSTAHKIFFIAQKFPELNAEHAAEACGEDWQRNLCGRLESASAAGAEEQTHLAQCLHWVNVNQPSARPDLRRWIGLSLAQFSKYPTKRLAVAALLQVLVQIIQGFSDSSSESKDSASSSEESAVPSELLDLYRDVLLPLHRPNGFFEWRDQLPLLQTYHEALMACLLALLRRNNCAAAPLLLPELFAELAEAWPEGYNANTAKEVILLHELEVLVTEGKGGLEPALAKSLPVLLPKLVGCIASDNWRLCEKVLGLWRVDGFAKLITSGNGSGDDEGDISTSSGSGVGEIRASGASLYYPPLMAALLRGGQPHWNPTVRRMTWLVLESLQTAQPSLFERTAEQVWGQPGPSRSSKKKSAATAAAAAASGAKSVGAGNGDVIGGSGGVAPASASSLLASAGFAQRPRPGVQVPDGRYRPSNDHDDDDDNQDEGKGASGDSSSSSRGSKHEEEEDEAAAAARAAIIDEHNRAGFPGRAMAPPPNVPLTSSKATSGLPPRGLGRGGAMAAAPWAGKSAGTSSSNSGTASKAPVKLPPPTSVGGSSGLVQVPGRVGGSAPIPTGKAVSLTAAPWASKPSPSGTGSSSSSTRKSNGFLGGAMSVAPWAKNPPASSSSSPQKRKANLSNEGVSMAEENDDEDDDDNDAETNEEAEIGSLGMSRLSAYMEACKPDQAAEAAQSARGWVAAQAQATPTLLPHLKFHDLVFGHELGRGSFSVVKYARQILKEGINDSSSNSSSSSSGSKAKAEKAAQARLGRSQWPEFAVKIVATEKIIAEGYAKNLVREIALLRTLSHPGIARMVSVFKWREGSYLVLEYASKGDLHGLVIRSGSLDVSSTQFVLGEAIAALCSVHDAGLVFGDLKPENLLVTEAGHVKLTDFGGCRPATAEAAKSLKSSKTALGSLRDGDWRSASSSSSEGKDGDAAGTGALSEEKAANDEEDDNDARVEGTVAYSAPEVVKGVSRPSYQADAWALGCVAYFCLRGRPPFFAEEDGDDGEGEGNHENLKRAIVSFEGNSSSSDSSSSRCGVEFPSEFFTSDAISIVAALLEPDPSTRLSVASAAMHPFFEGVYVHRLHFESPRPLSVGAAPPPPSDAKWARRQHSSIWAPDLAAYDFSGPSTGGSMGTGAYTMSPIPESSHERGASFLPAPTPKPQATIKASATKSASLSTSASLPLRARPGPRRVQPSSASTNNHLSAGDSAETAAAPLTAVRGVEGGIAEGSDDSEEEEE